MMRHSRQHRARWSRCLWPAAVLPRVVMLCCALGTAGVVDDLLPCNVHAAVATVTAGGLGVIPPMEGRTLAGDAVRLPVDLAPTGVPDTGRAAVLIVGFGREASSAARDWGIRLAADTANSPKTVYFEMPVLAGVPRMFRGSILRLMAGSVPERGKHHFLPITEQEAAWRTVVDFHDAAVPYILVVDEHGVVRWRTSGVISAPVYAELRAQLSAATP